MSQFGFLVEEWTNRIAVLVKKAQQAGELLPKVDPVRSAQSIVSLRTSTEKRTKMTRVMGVGNPNLGRGVDVDQSPGRPVRPWMPA